MKISVDRTLIDAWVEKAYPNGLWKLSQDSKIPANSLSKIRLGWVPKNPDKRADLARALGVSESDLFPLVESDTAS